MMRWMSRTLPPAVAMWIFSVAYAVFGACEYVLGQIDASISSDLSSSRGLLIFFACAAFGVYRVFAFHPGWRSAYSNYLRSTPWMSEQPLPLGPVHLVVQDLVVVGALILAGLAVQDATPAMCLSAFLASYLLALGITNACTGSRTSAYLVGFGFGLSMCVDKYTYGPLLVFLATYPIAWAGLRHALGQFPWEARVIVKITAGMAGLQRAGEWFLTEYDIRRLGYPLVAIKPQSPGTLIPWKDACFIALLCAWLLYGLFQAVPETDRNMLMSAAGLHLPICAPLIRALLYRQGAPIGLWGRIRTGRLLIPERDRVYLVPVLALTLGLCLGRIPSWFGAPPEIMGPVAVFVVLVMVLGAGPPLGRWCLVGQHHSVRPLKNPSLVRV